MGNKVAVDSERLAKVEIDLDHMGKDVGEIKSELSDFRTINTNVAESLARLTVIAEQNQQLNPKIDGLGQRLEARIAKNEKFIWQAMGAIAVISAAAPFVLKYIAS